MTDSEALTELHKIFDEANKALDQVRKDYAQRRRTVLNEWAAEHARFKIGDILQMDHIKICVELIIGCQSTYGDYLYVTYYGPTVTNKFLPTKDGFHTTVYDDGREIIKLNK